MSPSSLEPPNDARLPDPLPPDPPSPVPGPIPSPAPEPLGFSIPTPRPAENRRSSRITAAGIVLLLTGVLAVVGLVIVLSTSNAGTGKTEGRLTFGAALVFFSLAAINLIAATLVLRLRPNGRMIGFIAAGIGIVVGLGSLASSPSRGLLTLALDGFVAWVLLTEGDAFRGEGEHRSGTQGGR
jgi:hypothetical protein